MIRSDALRFIFGIKSMLKEDDNTIKVSMSVFNSKYINYINEYNDEKSSLINNIDGLNNKLNSSTLETLKTRAENTLHVYTISSSELNIDKCKYSLKALGAIYLLSGESKLNSLIKANANNKNDNSLLIAVKSAYKYPLTINNSINELINQIKSATDNTQISDLYNNIVNLLDCIDVGNKTNVLITSDSINSNSTTSSNTDDSIKSSVRDQIKIVIDMFLNNFENKNADLSSLNQKMELIDKLINDNIKIDDESIKSFINANKNSSMSVLFGKYVGDNNIADAYATESFNNIKKFICNRISEKKSLGVKFDLSKDFNFDKTVNDIIEELRRRITNTVNTNDDKSLKPIEATTLKKLVTDYKDDTTHSIEEFNKAINNYTIKKMTLTTVMTSLSKVTSKNLIISLFNNVGNIITSNFEVINIIKNWLNSLSDDEVKKAIMNSINDTSMESWKEWKSNQKIEADDDSQTINTNIKNKTGKDIDVILDEKSNHNDIQEAINNINEFVSVPRVGYNTAKLLYMRLNPADYIEKIYGDELSSIYDNDLSYLYQSLTNDNNSSTRLGMIFKIDNIIKNREFKKYNLGETDSIINKLLNIFSEKAIPKMSLNNVKNMMKNGVLISGNSGNNSKESSNISYLDKGDNLNNINEVNDDALNMYMNVVEPNLYTRQSNIKKSMELCNKLINDNDSMKSFVKYIEHNGVYDKFSDYCDSIIFFDNNYEPTINKFINKYNEVSDELKNGIEKDVISILNNGDFENNEEIIADFINNANDEDILKLKNSIQSNYDDIITTLSKYILTNATKTTVFEHLLYDIMSDNISRNSKLNNMDDVVAMFNNKEDAKNFILNRINRASINNTIPTTDENNNDIDIDNNSIDLISNQLSNLYYYFGREGIDQIIMKLLSNCNYNQTSKMMSAVIKFILANNIDIDKFISLSYNKYKLARSILSMSEKDLKYATGGEEGAKTLAKTISNIPDVNAVSGNIRARSGANNSYFAGLFGTK